MLINQSIHAPWTNPHLWIYKESLLHKIALECKFKDTWHFSFQREFYKVTRRKLDLEDE